MSKRKALFVSHPKKQCGVFEFGKNIFRAVASSTQYDFIWAECNSLVHLESKINEVSPDVIIYNYHPATMPWLCSKIAPKLYRNNISDIKVLQIGIIHEITQEMADNATSYRKRLVFGGGGKLANTLFDFYIAADPTLLLRNPFVYKTGRLVPTFKNVLEPSSVVTVGSFGFGTPKKGFENIVTKVQEEFDDAIIRLNIPSADFGDADGSNARIIAANCKALIQKPGIQLQVTHDFLDDGEILHFLAQNSINVFLYEDTTGRGLSSAVDSALAVQKPLALSESSMFRHVLQQVPWASVEKNSLRQILQNGFVPFQKLLMQWDADNMQWEYERILNSALARYSNPSSVKMGLVRTIQSQWRRLLSMPDKSFTWLRNTDAATEDILDVDKSLNYGPVTLQHGASLNRILDNDARKLYAPAIEKLFEIVPKTTAKKIADANVQQAFVLDTVCRFLPGYTNPKILCVGSYEDTASMSLIRMGLAVEEIDPMINYYLQEYVTKPTTQLNSYDIILSTSVIEHDPDDESFVRCINDLLAPGGVAVITCDYKDGWKPGDDKPEVDARFYTQTDLKERLLKDMPDCYLVDKPNWECPHPDFHYMGRYIYTFATFVVKKNL